MVQTAVACFLVSFLWSVDLAAQPVQDTPQPTATDSEYRKFDDLVSLLRARNEKQYAITSPKGIAEAQFVAIGGIEQWVTIRGWDRDNPVLLFLHGGPGDVTNPWTFALFAPWEKQFTVVQWDQRGAGRTLRKNGPSLSPTMTVDKMVQDGIELSEHLCKHLGKDKIIIVGHSFGSRLGIGMARARPDLFYAYVGAGQVADEIRNYTVTYQALLKKAKAAGNQQDIDELMRVGPPPCKSGEGYGIQRKWSNAFEGAGQFLYGTLGLALVAPGNTVQDINAAAAAGQNFSGEHLVPQLRSKGPKELGLEFSVPMFIFQGDEDFTTATSLAHQYEESMKAPKKAFLTIHGRHFAVFMNSHQFLNELVKRVRPAESDSRKAVARLSPGLKPISF